MQHDLNTMSRAEVVAAFGFDIVRMPSGLWLASHPCFPMPANEWETEAGAIRQAFVTVQHRMIR